MTKIVCKPGMEVGNQKARGIESRFIKESLGMNNSKNYTDQSDDSRI